MKIIPLTQIQKVLPEIDVISEIKKGFVAYSNHQAFIPPVGELCFEDPPGDVHIKYGHLFEDDIFVIKIASGFYENPSLGLPSSNGLMLIFSKKTGEPLALLCDAGFLTDIRTAAAGAIAAQYLAPKKVKCIGILGTGTQAKLQLAYLKGIVDCNEVLIWSRDQNHERKLKKFEEEFKKINQDLNNITDAKYALQLTGNIEEITQHCNLIITTTPSLNPLLFADQIQPGTHITAVGADSPHKQELDPRLFQKAQLIVADSRTQCIERGDLAHAIKQNLIQKEKIIELGDIISGKSSGRSTDEELSIVDLTGLAVQDIQVAKSVYSFLLSTN